MNSGILLLNTSLAVGVVEVAEGWRFDLVQLNPHDVEYVMCLSASWATILPFIVPGAMFLQTLYLAFVMRNFPHNFR